MVEKSRLFLLFLLILLEYPPKYLAHTCRNTEKIDLKYLENLKADSEYLISLREKVQEGITLITNYPVQKSLDEFGEDIAYENYLGIAVANLKLFILSTMNRLKFESSILNLAIQYASATMKVDARNDDNRYINIVDKLNGVKNDYEQLNEGVQQIKNAVSKICFAKDGALLNLDDAKAYVEAEEKIKEIKKDLIKIYNNAAFKLLLILTQKNNETFLNEASQKKA